MLTLAMSLPVFAFTLVARDLPERAVHNPTLHGFLDGATAGIVGLIAAVILALLQAALTGPVQVAIFAIGLLMLFRWNAKVVNAVVVLGAGTVGLLLLR